jgi:undecaprenyl-diphosphatase
MQPLLEPYVSFWRQYWPTILALTAIAALSVAGLYARELPFDVEAFRTVNAGRTGPFLDALGNLGYALGSFWFSVGLFGLLFLLGYRRLGAAALGAVVAGALLILLIKGLTRQPRPAQSLANVRLVSIYGAGPGYPSGHAAQAFLTAFLLASYFLPPWYGQAGLYLLAAAVALSRVYVGEHLPVDIIVGAGTGVLVALMWTRSRLWPGARARERS